MKIKRNKKNGKKVNRKNQLSTKQIMAAIHIALEECGREILDYAKSAYGEYGRGYLNITVKNHASNPYKRGYIYYVTEENNKMIQAKQRFLTDEDRKITELIRSYEPDNQAVVCVWHETMYFLTTLTDIFAIFDDLNGRSSLTVH
jgi:hypothetical protein